MLAAFIGVSAYELLQFLEEDVSVELAGVAPHLFAVGIDYEFRHRGDVFGFGGFGILVDIELIDFGRTAEELANLGYHGHHALAVRAPGGVEFYHYYAR